MPADPRRVPGGPLTALSTEVSRTSPTVHRIGNRYVDRLLRKVFRAVSPRRHRHNQHLWPYVRIARGSTGAISHYRAFGRDIALTPLSEGYDPADKQVHLILSGPSVAQIDYAKLDLGVAVGVNGSITLASQFHIPFKYYFIIDQNFVRRRIDLVRQIVARDLTLFLTPDVLRYIAQGLPVGSIKCRICVIESVTAPAYQGRGSGSHRARLRGSKNDFHVFDAKAGLGFSFDAARGVFDADTVAYSALQVLAWGGAKAIYFHGLDMMPAQAIRFYEEGKSVLKTRLLSNFESVIEPAFRQAAPLLRARNISLFNLSPASAISEEIVPRLSWQSLLAPGLQQPDRAMIGLPLLTGHDASTTHVDTSRVATPPVIPTNGAFVLTGVTHGSIAASVAAPETDLCPA